MTRQVAQSEAQGHGQATAKFRVQATAGPPDDEQNGRSHQRGEKSPGKKGAEEDWASSRPPYRETKKARRVVPAGRLTRQAFLIPSVRY